MNGSIASDYYYQRALRRVAATPPEVRAIPDTSGVTLAHVAAKTGEEESARAFGENIALRREGLRQSTGLAREGLALRRTAAGTARRQGRIATGISLANLAITGMGGLATIRRTERQQRLYEDIAAQRSRTTELLSSRQRYYDDLLDFFRRRSPGTSSWHETMRPASGGMQTT